MSKRALRIGLALAAAAFLMMNCGPAPEPQPVPGPAPKPIPPPPPPAFAMKPHHRLMSAEMRKSFDKADEIFVGVYTGSRQDPKDGLLFYFEDFSVFDKESLSWGPAMSVIVQVQPKGFKPEIITRKEFRKLSSLDRIGICWDPYEETRNIFLVEGEKTIVFLELRYDDADGRSHRGLIDTYPVTSDCNAKSVFDLMVRKMVTVD